MGDQSNSRPQAVIPHCFALSLQTLLYRFEIPHIYESEKLKNYLENREWLREPKIRETQTKTIKKDSERLYLEDETSLQTPEKSLMHSGIEFNKLKRINEKLKLLDEQWTKNIIRIIF